MKITHTAIKYLIHTVRKLLYNHLNSGGLLTISSVSKEYKGTFKEVEKEMKRKNNEKKRILGFQNQIT